MTGTPERLLAGAVLAALTAAAFAHQNGPFRSGLSVSLPSGYASGSVDGCWVLVDEDWQPSGVTISAGGVPQAGPMLPERVAPFNRKMGEAQADYPPAVVLNVDWLALCPGASVSSAVSSAQALEGFRRLNELYLGEEGRYSFNCRSVLEKRAVRQLSPLPSSAPYGQLGTGQVGVAPVPLDKGFRWTDRGGDWIEYSSSGQIVAWGDRNDNIVWLQRDTDGIVRGVVDAGGHVMYTLHYSGALVTEVRDYPVGGNALDLPARRITYQYDSSNRLTQVTDARGFVTRYDYDSLNRIVSITDGEGRAEAISYKGELVSQRTAPDGGVTDYEFDYDSTNRQLISKITGPESAGLRNATDLTHNRAGKLVRRIVNGRADEEVKYDTGARAETHTNARGFSTRIQHDEFGQVIEIALPDGAYRKYAYSAANLQLTEESDELGVKTLYERDAKGNLRKTVEALGTPDERITEYDIDAGGRPLAITRKGRTEVNGSVTPDARWQLEYDALGQLAATIDPEGHRRSYLFGRLGELLRYTDPKGGVWSYTYDADGKPLSETDPLGHAIGYGYDKVGNLLAATDERGKVYRYGYDANNRQTRRTDPLGADYATGYSKQGRLTHVSDASGKSMQLDYDALLRLTRATDAKGQSYTLDYTEADGTDKHSVRPSRLGYPTFARLLRYDAAERLTLANSQAGTESRIESHTWDGAGRRKTFTDANGKTRFHAYTPFGEVREVKDPLGNTMRLLHDPRGNVIEVLDPNGKATRMAYDRRSLLLASTDPLGNVTRYGYDERGWLTDITQANGQRVSYEFDAAGYVKTQREYDAAGTLQKTTQYTYDAAGNLLSWNDGSHSATRAYDDADRLSSESVNFGAFSLSHAYGYHANGQIRSYTGPDGTSTGYDYDGAAQLERVSIPGAGTLSVADWQWFQPKRVVLPGGTEQRLEYDAYQSLTRLKVVSPGQATVFELQNQFGKLAEVQQTSFDGASPLGYTHDDAGRLVTVTASLASGRSETFTLDAASNRTSHSRTGSGNWVYDDAGQLVQRPAAGGAGTLTYQYDAAGNLIRKTDSSKAEPARTTRYAWDALNRLTEVTDGFDALIARYAYDPFDRRIRKELGNSSTLLSAGPDSANIANTTVHYLQSAWGLLAEADAAGQVQVAYGWSPQRDAGTAPLFARVRESGGWRTLYYHNDHLGTPQRVTDASGAVVWAADYDAYGKAATRTTANPATALVNNLRLPGQYWDAETGLHYNDRRYYDPDTGRYTARDPIGFEGGINLYAYAAAAPGRFVDPTGEALPLCLLMNYGRCMTVCGIQGVGMNAIQDLLSGGCRGLNLLDVAKDCAIDCLWSMLPIPDPCGKFGKLFSAVAGLASGLNSFPAETLVHVRPRDASDGAAQRGKAELRPISQVKAGDEVLALDEWKDPGQVRSDSGERLDARLSYERVTHVISSTREQRLVHITLDSGERITATEGHPFRTSEGWRDAILLKRGGQLLLKSGEGDSDKPAAATIAEVRIETRTVQVFNLEVANAHTFFVGEEGALAHNGGRSGRQQRHRDALDDETIPSHIQGWIKQEMNAIKCGKRTTIRNPPGYVLAHKKGMRAKDGHSYSHSNYQNQDLHHLEHKYEGY